MKLLGMGLPGAKAIFFFDTHESQIINTDIWCMAYDL